MQKPSSIENYIQSETNCKDDERFFTDWQYQRNRPMRDQYRGTLLYSSRFSSWPFQRTKICFICRKVSCWLSNHTQQKRNDSKKMFGDRYSDYKTRPYYEQNLQCWIMEYEGVDNDENIAHYF